MPTISPALQRQRDVVDGKPAARRAAGRSPRRGTPRRPARGRRPWRSPWRRSRSSGARSSACRCPCHRPLAGDLPVAQHGDVVADADQLLQPVRDVDDRDAAAPSGRRSPGTGSRPRPRSSAEVGSSMIRMRASSDTALAISTSCCWPIAQVLDQRLRRGCRPRSRSRNSPAPAAPAPCGRCRCRRG